MQIQENRQGEVVILGPVGHLDTRTQHEFEEKVLTYVNGGDKFFVVDMAGIDYIASAGLRVLLMLAKKLTGSEGQLVLCAMNDHVKQVFDIAGFTGVFRIVPTLPDALQGFTIVDTNVEKVARLASRLMDVTKDGAAVEPASADDAAFLASRAADLLGVSAA
ncbi:MAG: STAS domain-containing protein, partial [Thermoanaerobaculia bacterium]